MLGDSLAQIPDPRLHRRISLVKSGLRVVGFALLPLGRIAPAILLVLAEALGVVEEMV